MRRPWNLRLRRPTAAAPAIAVLWCLLVAMPGGAVASPIGASHAAAPGPALLHSAIADFPSRAGFAPAYPDSAANTSAAVAPVSVDVVFEPRASSAGTPAGRGLVPVETFARAEGLSPAQYSSAEQYFASFGLDVRHTWPDRLVLSLEGPPAAMNAAFHTTLRAGTYEGRAVMFPATPPSLPGGLESEVAGVVGLTTGFQPFSVSLSSLHPLSGDRSALLNNNTITPDDARSYYNLTSSPPYPRSDGIALILWGAGYDPNDIQSFYANDFPSGLPKPVVTAYPIDGAPAPSPAALGAVDHQAVQELTLDIEWSGSMAPGTNLSVIYPPGPSAANLTDALEKALSLPGIVAVSMSFGAAESSDTSLAASWGPLFDEAATRRITLLAASGDFGGDLNASCSGGPAPSYPASAPQVISVGGTDLVPHRDTFGTIIGWNETGWSGSGGGFSAEFAAPSWQKQGSAGTEINASGGGRGMPDVSATATNDFLYFGGSNQQADGTSFATPLWAGIVADLDAAIGSPLGFFTDRLYHVAARQTPSSVYDGLRDIRSGQNCVPNAAAAPGWDVVTGWGSPQGPLLYYELVGSFVNLTVTESPTTLPPGGTVLVQTEVTNWTTGLGMANVPVTFSVASDTSVGPCTGVFGTVGTTSNASGAAEAKLSVPFCYLGAHATVQVRVTTPRLFGMNETHLAVNLLGFFPSLEPLGNPPMNYVLFGGIVSVAIAAGVWIGRPRAPASPPVPPPVPTGATGGSAVRPPPPGPSPPSAPVAGAPAPPPPAGAPSEQISQKT